MKIDLTSERRRILVGMAIVAMMTLALIILTSKQPSAPTSGAFPLPTFGLSPALQAKLDNPEANNAPLHLCKLSDPSAPTQTVACSDDAQDGASCLMAAVDKSRSLPKEYVPTLVPSGLAGGGFVASKVQPYLTALFAAATAAGHSPQITSAYRSYDEQARTFQTWVYVEQSKGLSEEMAIASADRYSARPGHSEHQLGTAIDINCAACTPFDIDDSRNVDLWKFLADHAHEFGFVVSYPQGIEALTGYQYEPWHLRYIGIEYAKILHDEGYLTQSGACLTSLLVKLK